MGLARWTMDKAHETVLRIRRRAATMSVAGVDDDTGAVIDCGPKPDPDDFRNVFGNVDGGAYNTKLAKWQACMAKKTAAEQKSSDKNKKALDKLADENAKLKQDAAYNKKLDKLEADNRTKLAKAEKAADKAQAALARERLRTIAAQRAAQTQLAEAKAKALADGASTAAVEAIRALEAKIEAVKESVMRENEPKGDMASMMNLMAMMRAFTAPAQGAVFDAAAPATVVIAASDLLGNDDDGGISAMLDY